MSLAEPLQFSLVTERLEMCLFSKRWMKVDQSVMHLSSTTVMEKNKTKTDTSGYFYIMMRMFEKKSVEIAPTLHTFV